jgi:hypothetical protein
MAVEELVLVGACWLACLAVIAAQVWVWHDDHRWSDRRRF